MKDLNFEQKLQKWAEGIINYCSPIAEKQNLEYYPLQSPLNTNSTDVLIVGINPRSNGNYQSQSTNEIWEFSNGKMTSERLLKGNPYFDLNDTNWKFFRNLKQINFLKEIVEDDRFTYMNYFYFTSSDAIQMRKIKGFQDIVTFSKKTLIELINIISPKLIIVLGVSDGLDIISDVPVESILHTGSHRILTAGSIQNIKLYAIPHPSRNYAFGVRDILSKSLKYIFENNPQKTISRDGFYKEFSDDIQKIKEKKANPTKEENEEVAKLCVKELEKEWKFHEKKNNRFAIADGHLSLTVTHTGKGYIGIRYLNNTDERQLNIEQILKKYNFQSYFDKGKIIWLGTKEFKYFNGNTPENISDNIISELYEVVSELEKIYQ